jgi:hypothetical protein
LQERFGEIGTRQRPESGAFAAGHDDGEAARTARLSGAGRQGGTGAVLELPPGGIDALLFLAVRHPVAVFLVL